MFSKIQDNGKQIRTKLNSQLLFYRNSQLKFYQMSLKILKISIESVEIEKIKICKKKVRSQLTVY